jgi:hypothetical protein
MTSGSNAKKLKILKQTIVQAICDNIECSYSQEEEEEGAEEEEEEEEQEGEVEAIVKHKGTITQKKKMSFEVKWVGDDTTTWEPWDQLSHLDIFKEYLESKNLESLNASKKKKQTTYKSANLTPVDFESGLVDDTEPQLPEKKGKVFSDDDSNDDSNDDDNDVDFDGSDYDDPDFKKQGEVVEAGMAFLRSKKVV